MPLNDQFIKIIQHPLKFRLFLFKKLPNALFSGLKILHIDDAGCAVSVPYKWFNKNPFRSTYFANLAMAAELSTGVLAMANVYGAAKPVSMLVVGMQAKFEKKATAITVFTCNDGEAFAGAVAQAVATAQPRTVTATTVGRNQAGDVIATFQFTWSFKSKN